MNKKPLIGLKRENYINHSQLLDSAFNSLASKYSNVEVFDVFQKFAQNLKFSVLMKSIKIKYIFPQKVLPLFTRVY